MLLADTAERPVATPPEAAAVHAHAALATAQAQATAIRLQGEATAAAIKRNFIRWNLR